MKKDITIKKVEETYTIRGEKIKINAEAAFDSNSGKQIFNEELDNKAINMAFELYREKFDVLGPDRIKRIRKFFNLTQRDFSAMLGWSPTTLATYETGSLPTKNNNIILRQIENNKSNIIPFYKETRNLVSDKGKKEMDSYLCKNKQEQKDDISNEYSNLVFKKELSIENGFKDFNIKKVANLVVLLIERTGRMTKTKLNKLLFYCDFMYFRDETVSITGLTYAKLPFGPVPDKYEALYSIIEQMGYIKDDYFDNNRNYYVAEKNFNDIYFSDDEMESINKIIDELGDFNAKKLTELSHKERGWKETEVSKIIPYYYACEMDSVE